MPKTTAAALFDGGGILARESITRQGLEVFSPAQIASELCTSDEEETRGSCQPVCIAAGTDETLTSSTLRRFSGGRLEASGKRRSAAHEDGVPLPARGYPGLTFARKVATLSRRPSPASPTLSFKSRRCDSPTAAELREDNGSLMVVNPVSPFEPALRDMLKFRRQSQTVYLTGHKKATSATLERRILSSTSAEVARPLTLKSFKSSGAFLLQMQILKGITEKRQRRRRQLQRPSRSQEGRALATRGLFKTPARTAIAEDCQSHIGEILSGTFPVTWQGTDRSSSSYSQAPADGQRRGGRLPRTRDTIASSSI